MISNSDDFLSQAQSIANIIKSNVETLLDKKSNTWDVLDYTLPSGQGDASYRLKIKIDNGGFVRVKALEREPGKDWEITVEEYNKGNIPEDTLSTKEANMTEITKATCNEDLSICTKSLNGQMQIAANKIKKEVESLVSNTFVIFDVLDHTTICDELTTRYLMKIKVDNNGYVRVNAVETEPAITWTIFVEEYNHGVGIGKGEISKSNEGIVCAHSYDLVNMAKTMRSEIQIIANSVKGDIKGALAANFTAFEVVEYRFVSDLDDTIYQVKARVDHRDCIKFRVSGKMTTKDWNIQVEKGDVATSKLVGKEASRQDNSGVKSNMMDQSGQSFLSTSASEA